MTPRFRDRPRVRTGLSVVPSLFTIGNMFAGYFSLASTMSGNYDAAAIAIFVGAVLDTLDGRIARLTGTASEFGTQLDSLADLLTFGVAPAVLALNWGLSSLRDAPGEIFQDLYNLGWLATFGFVVAGALRLARFNLLTLKPSDTPASKRHFVGLPTPAAAGVIAAVVHFHKAPVTQVAWAELWSILIAVLSFLMISTVRYPSFKDVDLKKPLPRSALLGCALLIGLVLLYSELTLLILAFLYVGSRPAARIVGAVRARIARGRETTGRGAEPHGGRS